MILKILLLCLGFVLLIKGSDIFGDNIIMLSKKIKLKNSVIMAIASSIPEILICLVSFATGNGDVAIGTIIGSTIINSLLILGLCSIVNPTKIRNNTLTHYVPLTVLISAIFFVLFSNNIIDNSIIDGLVRSDGIILLLSFVAFAYYLKTTKTPTVKGENKNNNSNISFTSKNVFCIILGLISSVIGSILVVNNAVLIAEGLEINIRIMSLVIIGFSTSLPELASSLICAVKDEDDILIENIIGSNVLNLSLALGLAVTIFGGVMPSVFNFVDVLMVVVSSLIILLFINSDKKVKRNEGIVMLLCFLAYYVYIFFI